MNRLAENRRHGDCAQHNASVIYTPETQTIIKYEVQS